MRQGWRHSCERSAGAGTRECRHRREDRPQVQAGLSVGWFGEWKQKGGLAMERTHCGIPEHIAGGRIYDESSFCLQCAKHRILCMSWGECGNRGSLGTFLPSQSVNKGGVCSQNKTKTTVLIGKKQEITSGAALPKASIAPLAIRRSWVRLYLGIYLGSLY